MLLLVDGMNLNDPKLAKEETLALRRRIQMVFQSPYASLNPRWRVKDILSEPIKAFNLIENPKAQIDRVHELLEQVGLASSDANKFPHEFSGGQRQRVAIARAILADPRVLILDDATSAVDPTKEHEIRDALSEVMANRTTIVIAHRPATIALADRVVLLDEGRIVASGTHSELLASSERYREVLAADRDEPEPGS